jgi:hypothetical protein
MNFDEVFVDSDRTYILACCQLLAKNDQFEFSIRAMRSYRLAVQRYHDVAVWVTNPSCRLYYTGFDNIATFQQLYEAFSHAWSDDNYSEASENAAYMNASFLKQAFAKTRKEMWHGDVDALGQQLSNLNVG